MHVTSDNVNIIFFCVKYDIGQATGVRFPAGEVVSFLFATTSSTTNKLVAEIK